MEYCQAGDTTVSGTGLVMWVSDSRLTDVLQVLTAVADVVLQFGTDSLNLHNHIIEEKLKNVLLTVANKESPGSRAVFSDKTDN